MGFLKDEPLTCSLNKLFKNLSMALVLQRRDSSAHPVSGQLEDVPLCSESLSPGNSRMPSASRAIGPGKPWKARSKWKQTPAGGARGPEGCGPNDLSPLLYPNPGHPA